MWIQGAETRLGCVGSFLAALTHAACTSLDPTVLSSALKHTLAWCTAQHFNTRLYAQVRPKSEGLLRLNYMAELDINDREPVLALRLTY